MRRRRRYTKGRVPRTRTLSTGYLGQGPQTRSQVFGDPLPYKFAVPQRGGLVHRDYRYGERDREDDW